MNKHNIFSILTICIVIIAGQANAQKEGRYFGDPMLTDSVSTLFIPTLYDEDFLTTNKVALAGGYYANIVVYDFVKDSSRKLFLDDTFIESFTIDRPSYNYRPLSDEKTKNVTARWVLLVVKNVDYNKSGRIDGRDPSILFATTTQGNDVRQLTGEEENVVSFQVFEPQGFVLVKIQRDTDNDRSFKSDDREYYFRKISLSDLTVGKAIELR